VTPELFEALMDRDHGCVVPRLSATAGECRDKWGNPVAWNDRRYLTVEHVHEGYGMGGKRASSTLAETVIGCEWHVGQRWELGHKPELRAYIQRANRSVA
jgi:hypothetical protein